MNPIDLLETIGNLAGPIVGVIEKGLAANHDPEAERQATLALTRALADARAQAILVHDGDTVDQ